MIYPEYIDLPKDFILAETYRNEAAEFFGYKSFDDYMKTENEFSLKEHDQIMKLSKLLQSKKHEAAGLFAERMSMEMALFHRSIKWLAALAIVSISISGVLVGIFILHC